ncbi:putative protein OS=Afipia felis OX=1035 GN=BN961_01135 PE=4 SV=1 [Afipia felis]
MPLRRNRSIDPDTDHGSEESCAAEAAAFIAETLCNLTSICHRHHFDTLGYLLDMAHMEADGLAQARRKSGP